MLRRAGGKKKHRAGWQRKTGERKVNLHKMSSVGRRRYYRSLASGRNGREGMWQNGKASRDTTEKLVFVVSVRAWKRKD